MNAPEEKPDAPTYNGVPMAQFLASCPSPDLCNCGSPMRSGGAGCTRCPCPAAESAKYSGRDS